MTSDSIIAETAALAISKAMNSFSTSSNGEIIVNKMLAEHPTINQAFTGSVVLPFVKEMAHKYQKGYYDDRNEKACEMCFKMWELLKLGYGLTDDDKVGLPMI